MATESSLVHVGDLVASADLSAVTNQFCFVKPSGARGVVLCAANSDVPIGILQNKPVQNDAADVAVAGESKILSGAAFSVGDRLMSDGSGRGITATGSGAVAGARAIEAATAPNQLVSCLVNVGQHVFP